MTQLEFEVCYTPKGKRRNEIDELGTHMNEMSQALEHTISELKSANNQLLLDIEKKTQIDRQRKEFLSNVSHELKTPLARSRDMRRGLKECINDDAQSRDFYCEVIMDEADKMNQMVKKLLTLNQLESGNRDDHDGALRRNRAHPGRAALGGYPHRAERHYGDGMSRRAHLCVGG